jgi:hypothetical protein
MARTPPPFYLVWNEDGRAPTKKHESEFSAEEEARRLARGSPGQKFCVLAVVSRIVTTDTIIERFDASDDVPF